MSECDKLNAMLTALIPEARARATSIQLINDGFMNKALRSAETGVCNAGLPGEAIKARFEAESTHGTHWAKLKLATLKARIQKGFGVAPILVNTGGLKRNAIADANSHYTLDNRVALYAQRIGKVAGYLNDGTPKMKRRPFYAPLKGKELTAIFAFAEGAVADYVYVNIGLF